MKVTFTGTGTSQGIPVIACDCEVCASLDFRDKRMRTAALIVLDNGKHIAIDCGPDFRQQMLMNQVKQLDTILFTHEHKDHTGGLDDVRAFNFRSGSDIPIYARDVVIDQLKQEYAYIFQQSKYPGIPKVETHIISNNSFQLFGETITPIEVIHYKLPVYGFRIQDFTYITDANFISEEEMEKIKGTKILVMNALRKREHLSHFTLNEALQIIEKIQPEKAYLTHLSHYMGLHAEVSAELPPHVAIAYDGLTISC